MAGERDCGGEGWGWEETGNAMQSWRDKIWQWGEKRGRWRRVRQPRSVCLSMNMMDSRSLASSTHCLSSPTNVFSLLSPPGTKVNPTAKKAAAALWEEPGRRGDPRTLIYPTETAEIRRGGTWRASEGWTRAWCFSDFSGKADDFLQLLLWKTEGELTVSGSIGVRFISFTAEVSSMSYTGGQHFPNGHFARYKDSFLSLQCEAEGHVLQILAIHRSSVHLLNSSRDLKSPTTFHKCDSSGICIKKIKK